MTPRMRTTDVQRQASDPKASVWVSANAGSGKTHALVDRVLRLLLAGSDPSTILCLTFTKAAAALMATRLFERLGRWIALSDAELADTLADLGAPPAGDSDLTAARRLFTRALESPGGLRIQTIHAFCERLLHLFPVEAGLAPGFEVLDERGTRELLEEARNATLGLAIRDPQSPEGRALETALRHIQSDAFDDLMNDVINQRGSLGWILDGPQGLAGADTMLRGAFGLAADDKTATLTAALADIDQRAYGRLANAMETATKKTDRQAAAAFRAIASNPENAGALLMKLFFTTDRKPKQPQSIATRSFRGGHPELSDLIDAEQRRVTDAARHLAAATHVEATLALLQLAAGTLATYESLKRARAAHDFDDLISRTRDLLAGKPQAAWVLYKLDRGLSHILVDEAQDTNPAQWQIVQALCEEFFAGEGGRSTSETRTLFAVGDRKQSIFSFQGAEPRAWEDMKSFFKSRIDAAGQRFEQTRLSLSYRTVQLVLDCVDAVFAKDRIARDGLEANVEIEISHQASRRNEPGLVEIHPVIAPEEGEPNDPWNEPVDRPPSNSPVRKLARSIAADIGSWIGRRRIAALGRAVRPDDILILVQRRSLLFDTIIRELRAADIPVAGADRLRLGESIAVLDLLALSRFALLAEDDYALACLLKSPIVPEPLSEDEIFALAHERGASPLWKRLQESPAPRCRSAFAELAPWLERSGIDGPYCFLARAAIRYRRRIMARLGSEADDAIGALVEAALAFERDHGASLPAFLAWFDAGETEIKRNMEQDTGEVRLMTVHGAKGLEANIVILPDTVATSERRNRSPLFLMPMEAGAKLPLWRVPGLVDVPQLAGWRMGRDQLREEEYRRQLYVAMTRARDELHIYGCQGKYDPKENCWYSMIRTALVGEQASGPEFRDVKGADGETDCWRAGPDPVADPEAPLARPHDPDLPAWIAPLQDAGPMPNPPEAGQQEQRGDDAGLKRGILVHKLLQVLPDVPVAMRRQVAQGIAARQAGDPSAVEDVLALFEAADARAFLAPGALTEVPIIAHDGEGRTTEGRIDRLIVAPDGVLILDFKSDRLVLSDPGPTHPYVRQLRSYAAVLRQIYADRPVRAALLWTSTGQFVEIKADLLS